MKDQNQGDRGVRKSNRQRVPNSFYTEGINQLKKQPRPPRQHTKNVKNRSKVYQDSQDASYLNDYIDQGKSELQRDSGPWYPCKLPKTGTTVKVQFVLSHQESSSNPIKKEETIPKNTKKSDNQTDLLFLFQQAIETVKEEEPNNKQSDLDYSSREVRTKPQTAVKQRRPQDAQGKITSISRGNDKLAITHSKLGEIEVQMQASSGQEEEAIDMELVEQYRDKIANCASFTQLSLFN